MYLFTSHNVSNKCNWLPYINPFFHLDITGVSWTIKTTSDNDWTLILATQFWVATLGLRTSKHVHSS